MNIETLKFQQQNVFNVKYFIVIFIQCIIYLSVDDSLINIQHRLIRY